MFERGGEPRVVNSQNGQNLANRSPRDLPFDGPADDFQVFIAHPQLLDDLFKQRAVVGDGLLKQTKLLGTELGQKRLPSRCSIQRERRNKRQWRSDQILKATTPRSQWAFSLSIHLNRSASSRPSS